MRRLAFALIGAGAALGVTTTVVLEGLNNPRGIAFGPEGSLYVAEAGTGGVGPCLVQGPACVGATSAITRLWPAKKNQPTKHERVVVGLPSHLTGEGGAILGVSDLAFQGGALFATIGLGAIIPDRANLGPLGPKMATLIQITGKTWRQVADLGAYELAHNPDGRSTESNPNGLLVDGSSKIVVDSAGNDLLRVEANGKVSTLVVFPERTELGDPIDPVPTAVVKGPDGAYYISQLTGGFSSLLANIYRFVPGHEPVIFRAGFRFVSDLAFDSHGNLYVLEIASLANFGGAGQVIKVAPDGTQTTIVDNLVSPTSIAVHDNVIYVSNHGASAGIGEVLKIVP